MKYPKAKGKSLENYVAKQLRHKYNVDERFIRRSGSSGTQTGEESDIFIDPTILKKIPFQIECKNQEKWKMGNLFKTDNKSNPFKSYLKQLNNEIKNYSIRYPDIEIKPLLVFSKQHEQVYCMFEEDKKTKKLKKYNHIVTIINNKKYIVMLFDDFLLNWK